MGLKRINELYIDGDELAKLVGGVGTAGVSGPESAVDENIAVFDGVTGKLIKDSAVGISDLLTWDDAELFVWHGWETFEDLDGTQLSATTDWSVLMDADMYAAAFDGMYVVNLFLSGPCGLVGDTSTLVNQIDAIGRLTVSIPYPNIPTALSCDQEFEMDCLPGVSFSTSVSNISVSADASAATG